MEYRQTDGKTRRVHKQYVDVVARILAGHGIRTATYKVRFGGHATELYLEDQTRERADGSQAHVMRWWVWAFDRTLEGERRR